METRCRVSEKTRRSKAARLAKSHGQVLPWMFIDAAPSRARVEALREMGWSDSRIARELGVDRVVISRLRRGQSQRIQARTAMLLRDTVRNARDGHGLKTHDHVVDALPYLLKLRSLQCIGWRQEDIRKELGNAPGSFHILRLMSVDQEVINHSTAERIDALFARLCMKIGPSPLTAKRSRNKGWLPPLALPA